MTALQPLATTTDLFVTLNPQRDPGAETIEQELSYQHPIFTSDTALAQKRLWSLQGEQHTWFCGAHFGSGFHEDGLQAGLAVAEQLGGALRPWRVAQQNARIHIDMALPQPEAIRLEAAE